MTIGTVYECSNCGHESEVSSGPCPNCKLSAPPRIEVCPPVVVDDHPSIDKRTHVVHPGTITFLRGPFEGHIVISDFWIIGVCQPDLPPITVVVDQERKTETLGDCIMRRALVAILAKHDITYRSDARYIVKRGMVF